MSKFKKLTKIFLFICAFFLGVYLLKAPSYPGNFEAKDITSEIQSGEKQDFTGATLVNLDEDNEQEIFISGHGSNNLLLKRNGDKFFPLNIPELLDPDGLTFAVTACDLDQDGRDEILILNRPSKSKNNSYARIVKYSSGKWIDILSKDDPITKAIQFGYSASCLDRKGDGQYGLVVSNENGKISYLEIIDFVITDIASEIGLGLTSRGRSVLGIPGPLGYMNIFVGNEEANFYFVNSGKGTFTEKAKEVGLLDEKFNARGMSIIDSNYDDLPDVIYGNHFGPTRLLEQRNDGTFQDVATEEMKKSYAVNTTVVGDFNLDGFEDIYLNNIRGDNKVFARYENKWYPLNIEVMAEPDMYGISTIAADLDRNGSYDILNTHGDGSKFPVTLYTVTPMNFWIKFQVKLANGGIPRGAVVRIRTSLRDHLRVISPGSGRFANYDHEVLLGLKKREHVTSVEVTLPSGKKIEFKHDFKMKDLNVLNLPKL